MARKQTADAKAKANTPHRAGYNGNKSLYDPAYCARVVEIMSEGKSLYEVAKEIGVSYRTVYNWQDKYEEFRDAVRDGMDVSRAWWERQGREYLLEEKSGRKFNVVLWIFNMKNRFRWRDNPDDLEDESGDAPEVVQV